LEPIIIKCTECGNTFIKESPFHEDVISCPICEAQFKAVVTHGKLQLEDFVFDEKDPGEL